MRCFQRSTLALLVAGVALACGGGGGGADPPVTPADAGPGDIGAGGAPGDAAPTDLGQGGGDATPTDARLADAAPTDARAPDAGPPLPDPIRINELMPRNGGTWVDELGALEDWIELYNAGPAPIDLAGYGISDDDDRANATTLPADASLVVPPGGTVILFADSHPEEGPAHVDFKLSGEGETVVLWNPAGEVIDRVEFPTLPENHSFARTPDARGAFVACEWPTPARDNGATCGPPPPPELPEEQVFAPYTWPSPWPQPPRPLIITEAALRPAAGSPFVEILNAGDTDAPLDGWQLGVAGHPPGTPWPTTADAALLPLGAPGAALAPGARMVLELTAAQRQRLEAAPAFEGVVTLFDPDARPRERLDFMEIPIGAALTRQPDATGRHRLCAVATPGAENLACDPLAERPIAEHVRHLRTPGDFPRLAQGGTSVGVEQVKFLIDLQAGGTVYFLDTEHWDLHYTFIRERIEHQPHLDRCLPGENQVFYEGWYRFSEQNYFQVEGRRFLMGTLVHHASAGLYTVEFTPGDEISSEQMRLAFLAVLAHADAPERFFLRPTEARQFERVRALEGRLPIVGMNAPFRGVTYQPLTEAVGYGVLTYVPAAALDATPLGEQVIVVTDQVPNDIPLVGGLITEAFQTPLAHVNLLSRNRGTPNMALRDAREDPRVAPYLGALVRLTVSAGGFDIEPAEPDEALAFWASRHPTGDPLRPRADLSVRGVVALQGRGVEDLPALGGKAAQFAELYRVDSDRPACPGALNLPPDAAAVPVVHSVEHFQASGAADLLARYQADPAFQTDPAARAAALADVRAAIMSHPVDPVLLAEVEAWVTAHYGEARARFRSSSNTEDLPGFNGAGLYTSTSGSTVDPDVGVADALRTVWASLWNARGYDERAFRNVDPTSVAMAVLIHPAYPTERANGVAISRNILEPLYRDHYINAQIGEASVTNPVPGVSSEQLVYHRGNRPWVEYLGRSSLTRGAPVLSNAELDALSCRLAAIHDHFQPRLDPAGENRWFAMDIEFKLLGDAHDLLIKQARQYSFGDADIPADCREF
jgi:hypothetical protein